MHRQGASKAILLASLVALVFVIFLSKQGKDQGKLTSPHESFIETEQRVLFSVLDNKYCSHGAVEFSVMNNSENPIKFVNGQDAIRHLIPIGAPDSDIVALPRLPETPVAPGFEWITVEPHSEKKIFRSMPSIGRNRSGVGFSGGYYSAILEYHVDGSVHQVVSNSYYLGDC